MGFLFGMYSDAGSYTCAKYAGSLGYEEKGAKTFASWDIDYLKYYNCFNEGLSGTPKITAERYRVMKMLSKKLDDQSFTLCNWGEDFPWNWAHTVAYSWRMSGDIYDYFNLISTVLILVVPAPVRKDTVLILDITAV
ncbi:glycoside hydrolase superfamily [Lipomyces starkeyi]